MTALRNICFLAVLTVTCHFCISGHANAAIYWGNSNTLGRVNLDGSYYLDGYGPGGLYIGYNGDSGIAGVCGVAVNETHIFWGDRANGRIGRANLDGSEPNLGFITGASEPCGVAVSNSHIFWANNGSNGTSSAELDGSIGSARLDGTSVDQNFIDGIEYPCGLAVNGSHIFWASAWGGAIGRATLEGDEVNPELIQESQGVCGVAVNSTHIFWGSYEDRIGRANLDGMDVDNRFIDGLQRPCAVAVDESHLYWTGDTANLIGRANLDGSTVNQNFVGVSRSSCGIAVDGRAFAPPPPLPLQKTVCRLGQLKRNSRTGSAIASVEAPGRGSVEVLTRGLRSRVLVGEAPRPGHVRWWWRIKFWPKSRGKAGQAIRRQLSRRGRATVQLRVRCIGHGELPTSTVRRVTLTQVKKDSR